MNLEAPSGGIPSDQLQKLNARYRKKCDRRAAPFLCTVKEEFFFPECNRPQAFGRRVHTETDNVPFNILLYDPTKTPSTYTYTCVAATCNQPAAYGSIGQYAPQYCKSHATEDMENLKQTIQGKFVFGNTQMYVFTDAERLQRGMFYLVTKDSANLLHNRVGMLLVRHPSIWRRTFKAIDKCGIPTSKIPITQYAQDEYDVVVNDVCIAQIRCIPRSKPQCRHNINKNGPHMRCNKSACYGKKGAHEAEFCTNCKTDGMEFIPVRKCKQYSIDAALNRVGIDVNQLTLYGDLSFGSASHKLHQVVDLIGNGLNKIKSMAATMKSWFVSTVETPEPAAPKDLLDILPRGALRNVDDIQMILTFLYSRGLDMDANNVMLDSAQTGSRSMSASAASGLTGISHELTETVTNEIQILKARIMAGEAGSDKMRAEVQKKEGYIDKLTLHQELENAVAVAQQQVAGGVLDTASDALEIAQAMSIAGKGHITNTSSTPETMRAAAENARTDMQKQIADRHTEEQRIKMEKAGSAGTPPKKKTETAEEKATREKRYRGSGSIYIDIECADCDTIPKIFNWNKRHEGPIYLGGAKTGDDAKKVKYMLCVQFDSRESHREMFSRCLQKEVAIQGEYMILILRTATEDNGTTLKFELTDPCLVLCKKFGTWNIVENTTNHILYPLYFEYSHLSGGGAYIIRWKHTTFLKLPGTLYVHNRIRQKGGKWASVTCLGSSAVGVTMNYVCEVITWIFSIFGPIGTIISSFLTSNLRNLPFVGTALSGFAMGYMQMTRSYQIASQTRSSFFQTERSPYSGAARVAAPRHRSRRSLASRQPRHRSRRSLASRRRSHRR